MLGAVSCFENPPRVVRGALDASSEWGMPSLRWLGYRVGKCDARACGTGGNFLRGSDALRAAANATQPTPDSLGTTAQERGLVFDDQDTGLLHVPQEPTDTAS